MLQFKKVDKKKVTMDYTELEPAGLVEDPGRKKKPKAQRYIAQAPERILDAPELLDDFYLNLLDWSERNIVAIALGHTVSAFAGWCGGVVDAFSRSGCLRRSGRLCHETRPLFW